MPYEKVGKNEPVCIADEVPFEIPDSWEWVRLGNISTYAETKKKINAKDADPSMWGLDLEDIEKGGRLLIKLSVGERKAIGDKTFFEKGDVLYSKLRPYLLKVLVADADGICTPEIVPFKLYGTINPSYIVAYLKSPFVNDVINAATYGIKMPRAGTETMTNLLVPIPPLNEQRRIVYKIEEIDPFINKYNISEQSLHNLNAEFPELLKKTILQQAVMGKLVPQDPDDEPASILLEKIRAEKDALIKAGKLKKDKHESIIYRRDNSHYEKIDGKETCIDNILPFEIPDSWAWCYIGTIAFVTKLAGFEYTKYIADNLRTTGVPLFKGKNVQNGMLVLSFESYIDEALSDELYRSQISKKCLLTPYVGSIGNIAIFDGSFKAHLGSNVGKIEICNPEKDTQILEEYVLYYLRSATGYDELTKYKKATAQESISIDAIRNVLIPIPPLKEQIMIVNRIEKLFLKTETL